MKIAFLGDVALFGKNTVENKSYRQMYEPIKSYLDRCDYVVANLETPLTTSNITIGGKSAYIKGTPADVDILRFLGITHVTLANNHMFDYREEGLAETIQVLEKNNIAWYGVDGKSIEITDEMNSVILMGYCCYSTNGKGLERKRHFINVLDPYEIDKEIADIEKQGKFPIISVHWGQEHVHYPNYDHLLLARKLCKNGKLLIHGHHPHVIQGIEQIDDSLLTYSLGNFCFDDVYTKKSKDPLIRLSVDNKESFVLVVEFFNNSIIRYDIIPFSFEGNNYTIKLDISMKIQRWSEFLKRSPDEYIKKRQEDLTAYLSGRKNLRNVEWYLKRLNLESVKMIIAGKRNLKKYNALVKKYISN